MKVSTKYNTNWYKEKRMWLAEISDFGPEFRWEKVDMEGNRVGLTLVSHSTGREAEFYIADVSYKGEDLVSWTLLPTKKASAACPGLKGTKFTIFND